MAIATLPCLYSVISSSTEKVSNASGLVNKETGNFRPPSHVNSNLTLHYTSGWIAYIISFSTGMELSVEMADLSKERVERIESRERSYRLEHTLAAQN